MRRIATPPTRRIAILATAGLLLLVLVIPQLVLPGIAADRIRDRLAKSGRVLSVSVSAFPAIELLWSHADTVKIKMADYRSSTSHLASLLQQTSDVGSLDASAGVFTSGLLTLRNATLRKRGDTLTGTAQVDENDLRQAIPILQSVTPIASSSGQLILQGTASLFGITATVPATVTVSGGRLLVTPDVPFGGLATLTLFDDPRVPLQSVGATATPSGFDVTASARLR
jgi:hypothetical protein